MTDKAKTILVSDLQVGDTIRITQDVEINDITDLNKMKPTVTKRLKLIKATAVSGGWRDAKGEFIISEQEKIELVKRPKPTGWMKGLAWEMGYYSIGGVVVIGTALALAQSAS